MKQGYLKDSKKIKRGFERILQANHLANIL